MTRITDDELESLRVLYEGRPAHASLLDALNELKELRGSRPLNELEATILDEMCEEISANPYVLGGEERSKLAVQTIRNLRADVSVFRDQRDHLQKRFDEIAALYDETSRERMVWMMRAKAAEGKIRVFTDSLTSLTSLFKQ